MDQSNSQDPQDDDWDDEWDGSNENQEPIQPTGLTWGSGQITRMGLPSSSETSPDYDPIKLEKRNTIIKWALTYILSIVIVGGIVFLAMGSGKLPPDSTISLASIKKPLTGSPTSTEVMLIQPSATFRPTATGNFAAALSPTTTPTLQNTATPTPTITLIPTLPPATATETVTLPASTPTTTSAECTPALEVTLTDVGKTLCVTGVIREILPETNDILLIFSNKKGAFYFVIYENLWPDVQKGACVRATGTIEKIFNNPIMVLTRATPLQACPK
jgi:hypothetical protein